MFILGMFYSLIALLSVCFAIFVYVSIAILFKCYFLLVLPFIVLFVGIIGAMGCSKIMEEEERNNGNIESW